MRRGVLGLGRDRRGTVAIEFALAATGLFTLLLGTISLGLIWWTTNGLQMTATMTARCTALGTCSPDPAAYAVALASQWLGSGAVSTSDVSASLGSQCYSSGGGYTHFAAVTITSSRWAGATLMGPFSHLTLSATACFPVQS